MLWKGRSRVILSKGKYPSQNENIFTFELVQMFGAATNTNKLCTATGGPFLAIGEHVTGGLVEAAARGLLAAHGWVAVGYPGHLNIIINLAPDLVVTPGITRHRSVHMRMMLAL